MAGYTAPVGKRTSDIDFDALWDALEGVPETEIGEIVGGQIVTMPRPGGPHTVAASGLGALVTGAFQFGINGPGGWVILDEPRIRFGDEMRIPDLAGWRRERSVVPQTGPFTVIPDWVCEVLSRSTIREDRTEKMPLYVRHGVSWAWLLDPVARVLEAYRRERDAWVVIGAFDGPRVRVEPFAEVELDLGLVWTSLEPQAPGEP
jgi:Uma2 family endonuclease